MHFADSKAVQFDELWIDPHYEEKHKDSINDQLILELVNLLNGWPIQLSSEDSGFEYSEADGIFEGKSYRLIIVIPPDGTYHYHHRHFSIDRLLELLNRIKPGVTLEVA